MSRWFITGCSTGIGREIALMPSWTAPIFSKMPVTCIATQPAMLEICQVVGGKCPLPWSQIVAASSAMAGAAPLPYSPRSGRPTIATSVSWWIPRPPQ